MTLSYNHALTGVADFTAGLFRPGRRTTWSYLACEKFIVPTDGLDADSLLRPSTSRDRLRNQPPDGLVTIAGASLDTTATRARHSGRDSTGQAV